MPTNTAIFIYVVFSIITIGILLGFLISCSNKTVSGFKYYGGKCLCNGFGGSACGDQKSLIMGYNNGHTEYTNFEDEQQKKGGYGWKPNDFSSY